MSIAHYMQDDGSNQRYLDGPFCLDEIAANEGVSRQMIQDYAAALGLEEILLRGHLNGQQAAAIVRVMHGIENAPSLRIWRP